MAKNQCDKVKFILTCSSSTRRSSEPLFIIRRPISISDPDSIFDYAKSIFLHELDVMNLELDEVILFLKLYSIEKKNNLVNIKCYGNSSKIVDLATSVAKMV